MPLLKLRKTSKLSLHRIPPKPPTSPRFSRLKTPPKRSATAGDGCIISIPFPTTPPSARRSTRCCRTSRISMHPSRSTTPVDGAQTVESEAVKSPNTHPTALRRGNPRGFPQSGADLPAAQKERIAAIEAELSKTHQAIFRARARLDQRLGTRHHRRVETRRPAGFRQSRSRRERPRQRASKPPPGASPCSSPRCFPIMQHLHDDDIRRQVWEASSKVGGYGEFDNTALVWQILELRHEKAEILGHRPFRRSHAAPPHGEIGETALEFIENLHARIHPGFPRGFQTARPIQGREIRPARRCRSNHGKSPTGRNASARKTTISMTRRCARISRSMA